MSVDDAHASMLVSFYPDRTLQGVERDLLLKRIGEMTTRFDEALMKLRREKIDLEMNLKAAEVQLLVLVQEHGLLVEFSARDDALAGKLAEKQVEQRVRYVLCSHAVTVLGLCRVLCMPAVKPATTVDTAQAWSAAGDLEQNQFMSITTEGSPESARECCKAQGRDCGVL